MNKLKLLVVIANYGIKNDVFLHRLVKEYRSLPYEVDIVVLTNVNKSVEGATEIVVHKPSGNPWTFPFAHKAVLAGRVDQYDLFIYSEDDTLVSKDNIEAFLAVTPALPDDEVAGFLRVEQTTEGTTSVSTINGHFHWDPTSVVRRGPHTFAYFTNEHAAFYLLTREQLKRAIQSGGFLVGPHETKYDLLVTAATDPYTQCGFRKLICISSIENFLISHLPNKYVGKFGVQAEELARHVKALHEISEQTRPPAVLLQTETRLRYQRWSKTFYEPAREDVIAAIPNYCRTVLSYACGTGALETELKSRGLSVVAAPRDAIVGYSIEAKGIEVVYGNADEVRRTLSTRRFDCILLLDILHLLPEPWNLVEEMAALLTSNGCIVASIPNVLQARTLWKLLKGDPAFQNLRNYAQSGVNASSYWAMRSWFERTGLAVKTMTPTVTTNGMAWYRAAARLCPPVFAREFVIRSERTNN
jgi:2-polyprenyl-3-methyl-5-hydroxy-6-metoxy-1,4-benzoquinol methylase